MHVHRRRYFSVFRCRFVGICRNSGNSHSLAVSGDIRNLLLNQRSSELVAFGRQRALNGSMLRITLPTADSSDCFILEGRLTGLWARELLRVSRGTNEGYGNIFDLQEVFYVDSEGEEALRLLGRRGARFITESAYGKDLCNRLKLDRTGPSEVDNHSGKRPEGPHKLRHRQTGEAGRPHGLTTDRSSCGQ